MNNQNDAPLWQLLAALLTIYIVWGSTYLGIRFALQGGFPPFFLGGIRLEVTIWR